MLSMKSHLVRLRSQSTHETGIVKLERQKIYTPSPAGYLLRASRLAFGVLAALFFDDLNACVLDLLHQSMDMGNYQGISLMEPRSWSSQQAGDCWATV